MPNPRSIACIAVTAALLISCAETQLAFHTGKTLGRSATPTPGYKIGKPYRINGVYYYPAANNRYRETGIASWYGPKFDGRPTANGEIFDMNRLTAAHRTLPLPSVVRVINLENGRAVNVRVNDRGPFSRGRIIDVSRRAAQLLGFRYKGTARVRVEILPEESRQAAMLINRGGIRKARLVNGGKPLVAPGAPPTRQTVATRPATIRVETLSPGPKSATTAPPPRVVLRRPTTSEPARPERRTVQLTELYIQAGAFLRRDNANRARTSLDRYGRASVLRTDIGREQFYRVRLGPISTVKEADRLLARLFASGYPKARIVVD